MSYFDDDVYYYYYTVEVLWSENDALTNIYSGMVLAYLQNNYALTVNAITNFVNANMTNVIEEGTVTMVNNDLTTGNN